MKLIRPYFTSLAALVVAALLASDAAAQLANPGFEDPVEPANADGAIGEWDAFNGGGTASSNNSNLSPRSGAMHLALSMTASDNNFAGAFQDYVGVSPGQTVEFAVWNKTVGLFDIGAASRIEWRNAANAAEVGRTGNIVPTLTSDYTQHVMSGVVPAGAAIARVVYAIQSFGAGGTNTGTVYVDDATVTVVPEPAAATLVALSALGFIALRRRG